MNFFSSIFNREDMTANLQYICSICGIVVKGSWAPMDICEQCVQVGWFWAAKKAKEEKNDISRMGISASFKRSK